jgi:ketosteroid isomerase-like protein
MQDIVTKDIEALEGLNAGYLRAVEASDARWFDRNLAEDFLNTGHDGTFLERAAFLERVARPAGISGLRAEDVRVRVLGDVAIIHARTRYVDAGGEAGSGRYTDVWARRAGRWQCVAAQVMRG